MNSAQVHPDVGHTDRTRTLQSDHRALRTNQFLRLFRRLFRSHALDRDDDIEQFVASAFRQILDRDVRNQVWRWLVINVDDDQELIAADEHVTLLQQIAVDDIQSFGRRVFLVVVVIEGSGRHDIEVERQPREFRESLEHVCPRSVSKVERDFLRLGWLGLFGFSLGGFFRRERRRDRR